MVALDGTKIKADAALESNRTYDHIESEVKKMLADAEAKDTEEDKLYGKDNLLKLWRNGKMAFNGNC